YFPLFTLVRLSFPRLPPRLYKLHTGPSTQPKSQVTVQALEVDGLPDDLDDINLHSMKLGNDLVISQLPIFDTSVSWFHHYQPG
ncbi:hypothetical protein VP01_6533g1, partial [Puccinia sorghi]